MSTTSTPTRARAAFQAHPIRSATEQLATRSLAEKLAIARLELGERMFAANIDDGQSGEGITALNQAIPRAASQAELQRLSAERDRLLIRLADAALANEAPLPGADVEYARVRQLLAAQGSNQGND